MVKIQNNTTRYLTQKKVPFTLLDLGSDEKLSAVEVAERLEVPPSIVFKTIVIVSLAPNKKPILAVVPADKIVDLKKTALLFSEKKLSIPTQTEAERITGLLSGGISPLALINKGFAVIIETSAQSQQEVIISAGERGYQIKMSPLDLAACVNAQFHQITKEMED